MAQVAVPSQVLLDALPIGVCVFAEDHKIVSWNRTLEKWTHIDRTAAVATSLLDYLPALAEKRYASRIKQVFTDGTVAVFSPALHAHLLPVEIRSSGTTGLMVQSTQVRRIAERPKLAIVSISDVTEEWTQVMHLTSKNDLLSAAESRERDITQRLRRAISEIESRQLALDEHSIVATTDPEGTITYVNDKFCEISQYSRDELIGKNYRIINSGHHPSEFFAEMWGTIASGRVWQNEICNRTKDGSLYWVDTTIVPYKDEDGRITHYAAIRTDITERKRQEKALEASVALADAANQAKSDFLANMSHEIRTPMTAILGFSENMLDPDQSDSERLNCIHTIRRNGEYLIGLINDILDLSKIEAGKMEVECRDCRPCALIAEVASLMRVRASAKGLPLNIEFKGAIPETIKSDATRLRQILVNMIGNAIKFTKAGNVRLLTCLVDDSDGAYLQFDIVDTGCGMTPEQGARLFQPFTQADTSTTRNFGGTGLGLTISKQLAEMLGGCLSVVATEVDVGSTFRVRVATGNLENVTILEDPLSATVVDHSASASLQVGLSDLCGVRILLAEDSPDNQRLISHILKKAGADVAVEENGKLALDAAFAARDEDKPFDVILMDMQMPVMDGYKATELLRRRGYTEPIIALTAHTMSGDREKCISSGCNDFATKPIDRKKLVGLILQYVQDPQLEPDTDPTGTPGQLPLHGCCILLAEDNSVNQVLVVGILKKAGAEVTAVKDGKLAFDAAVAARDNGSQFDIILMDIQMPLMRGDEATKLLRKKGYTGKIISLTASATDDDRPRFISMGFDDTAQKPVNKEKLIETIRLQWVGSEFATQPRNIG